MPEAPGSIEVAHALHEHGEAGHRGGAHGGRRSGRLEIFEAVLLAVTAVATAWSGYQAARWDGFSAEKYAEASGSRIQSAEMDSLGGMDRLHDLTTFTAWIEARAERSHEAAALLERRFTPEFRAAFDAWMRTDPLNNPAAPPGPAYMPEYRNVHEQRSSEMARRADEAFEKGRTFRETGEDYVRVTVLLATGLFLIAVSQRFTGPGARIGTLAVAAGLIGTSLYLIASYPLA